MLLRERIDKTIHVAQTDKRVAVKVVKLADMTASLQQEKFIK
jgi:hypothetical protein